MADTSRANQAPPTQKKPSSMNNAHPKQTQQDNVHNEKGTTGNNHFHLEHDDTYNLPPFLATTITLGTKSPTGKQYMCTSGQQLEEGTWQTQPQEYKTFSLSHVMSNNKILTPGNINHRNKKHSHSYTSQTTTKVQTPGNNNPMNTKTRSSSISYAITKDRPSFTFNQSVSTV